MWLYLSVDSRREFIRNALVEAFAVAHDIALHEQQHSNSSNSSNSSSSITLSTASQSNSGIAPVPPSVITLILAYTFDWRLVTAGANDPTIKIWNLTHSEVDRAECERSMTGHTDGICCVTVLKDGRLVTGSEDVSIKIWTVDSAHSWSGRCERTLTGHTRDVLCTIVLQGKLTTA
jgi:WD40 repeat protein